MFWKDNHPEINYHGGQEPIVHLVADFHGTIAWAEQNNKRWVFTSSNAGSAFFDDFHEKSQLSEICWGAVRARNWQGRQDQKQAEFLIEEAFPWTLVEKIGVFSESRCRQVNSILERISAVPPLSACVERAWYYGD